MSTTRRRRTRAEPVTRGGFARALIAAAIITGVAGCAQSSHAPPGPTPPTGVSPALPTTATPALPPRPVTLSLTGVQPCGLLAGPGAAELGVQAGIPSGDPDRGTAQCQWSHYGSGVNDNWLARAEPVPAASALAGAPDSRVVSVGGFPAVQTDPSGLDPARACELHIDVNPTQSLLVRYLDGAAPSADNSPDAHAAACQKAHRAADAMVTQLRETVP